MKKKPLQSNTVVLPSRFRYRSVRSDAKAAASFRPVRPAFRNTKFRLGESVLMAAVVGAIFIVSLGLSGAKRVYKIVRLK